jgi:hypothetical protein
MLTFADFPFAGTVIVTAAPRTTPECFALHGACFDAAGKRRRRADQQSDCLEHRSPANAA